MKKIFLVILCMALMSSLAACGSKGTTDNQELSYNKKEIIATAKKYIKDKYNFEPKIITTKNMMTTDVRKKTTIRSSEDIITKITPSNDILVEMEYDGKKFTTVVANEFGNLGIIAGIIFLAVGIYIFLKKK